MFSCSTLTAPMTENAHKVCTDIVLGVHDDDQLIRRTFKSGTPLRHTPTAHFLRRPSHTSRTRGFCCAVIAC